MRFLMRIRFILALALIFVALGGALARPHEASANDSFLESHRNYNTYNYGVGVAYTMHFANGHGFVRVYYWSMYGYWFSEDYWFSDYSNYYGHNEVVYANRYGSAAIQGAAVFWSNHAPGTQGSWFMGAQGY